MRYQYYYCCRHRDDLVKLLEHNKIKYRLSGGDITPLVVVFSIRIPAGMSNPIINTLFSRFHEVPIVSVEYSATELKAAEWIWMRPTKQRIDIINTDEAYHYGCEREHPFGLITAKHQEQIGPFAIAKEPAMNTKTAFWAEDTGFAEVFADWRVRELAEASALSGIEFKDVLLRNGNPSSNLYQMTSTNVLPLEAIACGHGEKALRCPYCGKPGFQIDNAYQLHLHALYLEDNVDIYVTERVFGEGIAYPLYLISQRFYRLLVENQLAGSVTFSPVVAI